MSTFYKLVFRIAKFDASTQMTEETHNAAMSGPIGIITAIGVSAILGWFLVLSLLFSIQGQRSHRRLRQVSR
jgi:amino acid transporter